MNDSSLNASYKFGDEENYTRFNDKDSGKKTRTGVEVNTYAVLQSKYLVEYFSDHRSVSVDVVLGYK